MTIHQKTIACGVVYDDRAKFACGAVCYDRVGEDSDSDTVMSDDDM